MGCIHKFHSYFFFTIFFILNTRTTDLLPFPFGLKPPSAADILTVTRLKEDSPLLQTATIMKEGNAVLSSTAALLIDTTDLKISRPYVYTLPRTASYIKFGILIKLPLQKCLCDMFSKCPKRDSVYLVYFMMSDLVPGPAEIVGTSSEKCLSL